MQKLRSRSVFTGLLITFISATLIRLILFIIFGILYEPGLGDDVIYRNMAVNLLQTGSFQYQGQRPPLYPFLLATLWFIGGQDNILFVVVFQQFLGILTAMLWAHSAWLITRDQFSTILTGIISTLILPVIILELRLLTEPLALFLLTSSMWSFLMWHKTYKNGWLMIMGMTLALLGLTRISWILAFIVPWLVFIFINFRKQRLQSLLIKSILIIGPSLIGIFAWLIWQQQTIGRATLSSFSGYSLTNTVCSAIQHASDEFAPLRDIYIKYRSQKYEQYGSCAMTIWQAYPEMMEQTGLSFVQLSQELGAMSLDVIKQRPTVYARSVMIASLLTLFDSPVIADSTVIKLFYPPFHYGAILLALMSLGIIWIKITTIKTNEQRSRALLMLLLCIGYTGYIVTVSSLLEFGENGRYRFPIEMGIHWCWIMALWLIRSSRKEVLT